ncbi:hypothetical protein LAUMK41_01171 [Mycobacterium attenuatum]|nr:hypothetical protein LAUMK41_01171 [Mycobacterium attenuatum]
MRGHQRRRTCRVHGDSRALQTQRVGDTPGSHTGGRPGHGVSLRAIGTVPAVLLRPGSDEHPGLRTDQRGRVNSAGFQRFPAHLQQQPLLGIHGLRLPCRNPEKLGVKPARVGQKRPGTRVGLAHRIGIRIEQIRQIPAAIGRKLPHRLGAAGHQIPQRRRRIRAPGEPAGHPHHCYRLIRRHLRPHRRSRRNRPAQQLAQVGSQHGRGGVVESQGGWQFQLGDGIEAVEQFGGFHRVEPQVLKRALGVDVLWAGIAQDGCRLRAHHPE